MVDKNLGDGTHKFIKWTSFNKIITKPQLQLPSIQQMVWKLILL